MLREVKNDFLSLKHYVSAFSIWQKILLYSCIFLFGLTSFSIAGFSGQIYLNYLNIGIEVLLALLCFFCSCFIFKKIYLGPYIYFWLIFNLLTVLSFIVNGCHNFLSTTMTVSFLSFFFFEFLREDERLRKASLFGIVLGLNCFCLWFGVKYSAEVFRPSFLNNSTRAGSFFGNINWVALVLAITALGNFYFLIRYRGFLSLFFFVFSSYLILLTGSISNLLSLGISIIFFAFFFAKKKQKIWFAIFFLLLLIIFIICLQLPSFAYFKNRIDSMFLGLFNLSTETKDPSSSERALLAQEAFLLFLKCPVFGAGFTGVSSYALRNTYAHNNFLEIAADFGVFSAFLYESFLLFPIFCSLKKRGSIFSFTFLTAIFLFLSQFFIVNFNGKIEILVFCFFYSDVLPNEKLITSFPKSEILLFQTDSLLGSYFGLFQRKGDK